MKLYSSFFLLFIISGSLSAQVANDSLTVDLHVNLQPGEKYAYTVSVDQEIIQEIMGDTLSIGQQLTTDYSYLVKSNDGEAINIEVTYDRIQINSTAPQGTINYDSELGGDNNLGTINSLVGKPFNVFMNSRGKIYKVEGFDELTKDLETADLIKEFLSDSTLIKSLDMNIYPDAPVAVGESWNRSQTLDLKNIRLQNDITYTLEGTSEDLAWLNVSGEIQAAGSDPNVEMDLSANQTGTMETDLKSGMIVSSNVRTEMQGILKTSGLEIPVTIVSDTKIEGKKL